MQKANKHNVELIDRSIAKAKERKGLSHREAAVLLDCDIEEKNEEIYALAEQIKKDFYGNRIVMFAPLYSVQLLCQRMYLLSVPFKEQAYREKKN